GSYAIESMTLDIERQARALIEKIDGLGGALAAIESGFMQNAIADAAYVAQRALESKESIVVGVNDFIEPEQTTLPLLVVDERIEREQVERLRAFRQHRRGDFRAALSALHESSGLSENVMPHIIHCVRNDCTVGEIVSTLKQTFGEHRDAGF